jgi:hypothetical protein
MNQGYQHILPGTLPSDIPNTRADRVISQIRIGSFIQKGIFCAVNGIRRIRIRGLAVRTGVVVYLELDCNGLNARKVSNENSSYR